MFNTLTCHISNELLKKLAANKVGKLKSQIDKLQEDISNQKRLSVKEELKIENEHKMRETIEKMTKSISFLETMQKYIDESKHSDITVIELDFLENPYLYDYEK